MRRIAVSKFAIGEVIRSFVRIIPKLLLQFPVARIWITSEQVERVRLDQQKAQFLFRDDNILTFMDAETYEQLEIDVSILGDQATFLQDGMEVMIESYDGDPLSVVLPDTAAYEVVEADAVVKGQTASSSYKPAVLENGAKILVPPHIEAGTRVIIKPEDGSYVERAKD